jgi:NADH-quinone oxidoreductase subunit N
MNPAYALGQADLVAILPEILLTLAGIAVLLLDAFVPATRKIATLLSGAAVLAAGWAMWTQVPEGTSFHGALESNALTTGFSLVILISAFLSLLATDRYLRRERILSAEYHALLLWCVAGALFMVRATELLTVFLALELLSICLYALAGFHRRVPEAAEAAIKYFLMGAFVSSFLLLGIALLYGETGSTQFSAIADAVAAGRGSALLIALGFLLVLAAFGFKLSVVPFHAWAPDTYQGAPTPFVAFLSVAPKAASAVVFLRVLQVVAEAEAPGKWVQWIALLAAASMLVGNLLALVQRDLKRMLAYSGIAHMGYLLLAFVTVDRESWSAALLYFLAYALMNAGAFAIVTQLFEREGEPHLLSDVAGWGYRRPLVAACLTVCLLSLAGIPPTLGFLGKYFVFLHALRHGHIALAILGVLASLVGVFYYLRVVYFLYMKPEVREPAVEAFDFWGRAAAVLAAAGTLLLGVFPGRIVEWLSLAVARLG